MCINAYYILCLLMFIILIFHVFERLCLCTLRRHLRSCFLRLCSKAHPPLPDTQYDGSMQRSVILSKSLHPYTLALHATCKAAFPTGECNNPGNATILPKHTQYLSGECNKPTQTLKF